MKVYQTALDEELVKEREEAVDELAKILGTMTSTSFMGDPTQEKVVKAISSLIKVTYSAADEINCVCLAAVRSIRDRLPVKLEEPLERDIGQVVLDAVKITIECLLLTKVLEVATDEEIAEDETPPDDTTEGKETIH